MSRSLHTTSFGLHSGHRGSDLVPYDRFLETCEIRFVCLLFVQLSSTHAQPQQHIRWPTSYTVMSSMQFGTFSDGTEPAELWAGISVVPTALQQQHGALDCLSWCLCLCHECYQTLVALYPAAMYKNHKGSRYGTSCSSTIQKVSGASNMPVLLCTTRAATHSLIMAQQQSLCMQTDGYSQLGRQPDHQPWLTN